MVSKADAVIIGGGIVGLAVAYNLAKKGLKSVVLEKEATLVAGSTAKAAGGIRAQFTTPINIQLSILSERIFEAFQDEMGVPAAFEQVGYLFVYSTQEEKERFQKTGELQRRLGLPIEFLKPEEVRRFSPELRTDDLLGANFCVKDGLGDPYEFGQGYARAARELGAQIYLETPATGIEVENEKVVAVGTSKGKIATGLVINAAGPYAAEIGKMAGIDIPVLPLKRQITKTAPIAYIQDNFPMVVDAHSGLYMHKESGGLLMGFADATVQPSYDTSVDAEYTDKIIEKALWRIPALETAELAASWAGLYETTPDHNAILGPVPEVKGFISANGFSGHGFMHAPAVGLLLAELIVEGKSEIDLTPLSITRFRNGKAEAERNVI